MSQLPLSAPSSRSTSQSLPIRLPPSDIRAESAVVGACIRDNKLILDLSTELKPEDFYDFRYRLVWAAMVDLNLSKGWPVDLITLSQHMAKLAMPTGGTQLDEVGGPRFIADLWDSAPIVINGASYAKVIRHKAMLRSLLYAADEMIRSANDPTGDPDEIMEEAARSIFDVQQRRFSRQAVSMNHAMGEFIDGIDRRVAGLDVDRVIHSGWRDYDYLTAGFHRGELIVLAARPSIGKTVAALNIAEHVACIGKRVLFCSLEQSREDLAMRLMCLRGRVESERMRKGDVTDVELERIKDTGTLMREYGDNLVIDDSSAQTVTQIAMTARRQKMKVGLDLMFVDYMQLIKPATRDGTRNDQVAEISAGLKQIAKDLNVPVIALSQLNRRSAQQNAEPELSDLRDSGAIEQDADTVIMLHPCGDPDDHPVMQHINVLVKKQRNGPRGKVLLDFHKKYFEIKDHVPMRTDTWRE